MTLLLLGIYLVAAAPGGASPPQTSAPKVDAKADLTAALATLHAAATAREELTRAAVTVATSGNAAALQELGRLLTDGPFLARLEAVNKAEVATESTERVFRALAANPSKATEALCLKAYASGTFTLNPLHVNFALDALSAVRPMSAATTTLFERTGRQGYFAFNGPLLARNGSERAMTLLASMFTSRTEAVEARIDLARQAIVPNRTSPPIVQLVAKLTRAPLEPELVLALIETLYDYRPSEWYAEGRPTREAPSWSDATPQARRAAAALGRRLLTRPALPAALRTAIEAVVKS